MSEPRRKLLVGLGLLAVLAGLLPAYAPALDAPPVFDSVQIWSDPLRELEALTPKELWRVSSQVRMEGSRWLPNASFALNRYWAGSDTAAFRLVNLAIHALVALALFAFLRETLRLAGRSEGSAARVALLATALFAWNPVQVQAVTYIWQRSTSLVALLVLLSLWAFARGLRRAGWRRWLLFAGAGLLFPLALATKQNAGMLPATMGLFAWLFATPRRPSTLGLVTLVVAGLGALLFWVVAPVWFGTRDPLRILDLYSPVDAIGTGEHLLTQARVVLRTASLLLLPLPSRLHIDPYVEVATGLFSPWTNLPAATAVLALVAGALAVAPRHPLVAFAALWYFLWLVPESTIFQLGLMFEHRAYLPGVGPLLGVALAAEALGRRAARPRLAAALAAVALAGLLLGTWVRNGVWTSPRSVWADAAAKAPRNPRPHWNLGAWWERHGGSLQPGSPEQAEAWERAERHYRRALALAPDDVGYRHGYARFQTLRGRWEERRPRVAPDGASPATAVLYTPEAFSANATPAHRIALRTALAAELRRGLPSVAVRVLDEALRDRSLGGRAAEAYRIISWISEIEFERDGRLRVSCRVAAKITRREDPEGSKFSGYAVLYGEDTPEGRDEAGRRCVATAGRNLASYYVVPGLRHLVLFDERFQPEPEGAPAPHTDAGGSS